MANARDVYNVDANKAGLSDPQNRQFDLSFPYLSQSHVSVTVNGTATTAFTYATSTRIQLNTGPTAGDVVVIQRATSPNTRLVDYQTGSVLSDEILDRDSLQAFYLAQEANDVAEIVLSKNASDLFDAGNERITNVANPTGAQDVATKNYLENTWLSSSDKTQLNALNTTNLNTVAGSVSNVNTVAGAITNVNTVAGKSTEIAALGTTDNIQNMDTLAASGVVGNIASVAGISSDVTTVAGKASLITSDFVSDLNTVAVTDVINDINLLATSDVVSDLNQLATSDFVSDLNQLATTTNVNNLSTVAGIAGNVTSVAGVASDVSTVAGISSAVSTVAADGTDIGTVAGISSAVSTVSSNNANVSTVAGAVSNIGTVAGAVSNVNTVAGAVSNVNTVAGISSAISTVAADATDIGNVSGSITNVNTVATNISGVNSFAAQYRIGSSDPTASLDEGDLFYNTTANQLKIYNGSQWENAAPAGSGFLATSGGTMSGNLALGDGVKATFGAESDLQIYHDAGTSNSFIDEQGPGNLIIRGTNIQIKNSVGADMADFTANGAARLFFSNQPKMATTSTGVDVTGTVQADKYNNDEALPDIRPSLLLDFANSKTLDPRITFTRGSTATYWDGKTTAKAEENLFYRSQEFGYWGKINVSVSADSTAAPDGTTTADTITEDTASSDHYINVGSAVSGVTYTVSCYAKNASGTRYFGLRGFGKAGTHGQYPVFDLVNGTIINSGTEWSNTTITDVGNGWYRCSSTVVSSSTTSGLLALIKDNGYSYTGDGTSGIYLWGAQLEQRSSATAYTPTTSAPIVKYQPVLQTAASGAARFDHNPTTGESKGLLIEEARTNLVTYSEAFNSWTKLDTTVESNAAIAPDGTLTADKIVPDATSTAAHRVSISQGFTSGTSYAFSVYAKAGEKQYIDVRWYDGSTNAARVVFDVSNGTVTNTYAGTGVVEDVGNGWYRCSVYASATNTSISGFALIYVEDSSTGAVTYSGDGYSGIYIWGAQMEEGSFPTSYIPTSGSTVTRAVDSASITSSDTPSFLTQGQGTFFTEFSAVSYSGRSVYAFQLNGSSDNIVYIRQNSSSGFDSAINFNGTSVSYKAILAGTVSNGTLNKAAVAYSTDSHIIAAQGSISSEDTTVQIGDFNEELGIGTDTTGNGLRINGHMKKLAYYPKRLSNATLQAMTTE